MSNYNHAYEYIELIDAGDSLEITAGGHDLSSGLTDWASLGVYSTAKFFHSHGSEGTHNHAEGCGCGLCAEDDGELNSPDIPDLPADTSTSGVITIGGPAVTGEVGPNGDHDWYAVTLTAGQSYTFHMVANGNNPTEDPLMRLFDANGTFILENDDVDDPNSSDPRRDIA